MSETDKELLELAAKAAGHQIDPIDLRHEPSEWICWNPLTDDGDALRLAVKLGIDLKIADIMHGDVGAGKCHWSYEGNPYGATRRAIVHAAAQRAKEDK